MSGTGRRRKPPAAEDGGGEQYAPPPYEQPQYQTYAPAPEPQYDYDWREGAQQAQQPSPPVQPVVPQQPQYQQHDQYEQYDQYEQFGSGQYPQAPQGPQTSQGPQVPQASQAPAAPPAPQAPQAPVAPQAPQPDLYSSYESYPAQPEYGYQPPAAAAAPAAPPVPPAPSAPPAPPVPPVPSAAGQSSDFEFDIDLDEDAPAAAPAASSPAPATSRPADKDGYRPDDFDFVDKSDEPDVGGWLTFSESRADTRAERARRMRGRLIALGVLVALVGAGVGIYAWLGGSVPGLTAQDQATKSMILFRLDDATGDAVGDALMVTNRGGSTDGSASGSGAIVVIPSQMQIDDQGFGAQPFGGNMASAQPPAGPDEVASALGVTPDGTWTMNETTFGIFVDEELDGISVTTNTAVAPTAADPKGVSAGSTILNGAQAVAYATYQAPGEAASVQAARFAQVLEGVVAKMPTYSNAVMADLNQLGIIPDPALPLSKLSPILAALAAQQTGGRVTVATLPLSAGSETLNSSGAAQIVDKLLGGTLKAGASAGQSARVLVQNGTGVSGSAGDKLDAAAQAKLVDSGFTYNAGTTVGSQAKTVVEVSSSSGQGVAQQVAASLGLSGGAVQVVSGLSSVDDVTVVLGRDWTTLSTQ